MTVQFSNYETSHVLIDKALGHYGWTAIAVGGLTTLVLVVLYVINVVGFIRYSPPQRWRLLCWVTSVTMVRSSCTTQTCVS